MNAEILMRDKKDKKQIRPLVYKGQWGRDALNGDGMLKLSNGLIILGQFHNGILKDTYFQVEYPNGDTFCGQHRGGVKHGKGTYHYKKKDVTYQGQWVENQKSGKGEMIFQ